MTRQTSRRFRPHLVRPLAAALALIMAAGLALALPAAAGPVDGKRAVRGTQVAASSLGSTVGWAYDVNARGVGYAAWVDGDGDRRRVLVAKRDPRGDWGKPQRLTGLFSWRGKRAYAGYPDVAVDSRGRATVVWAQSQGPGVRVRVATSQGKGWSKPRNLSARRDFTGFPDVEVSDAGHAVVSWAGDFAFPPKDFTLMAAYRTDQGSWSRETRLDTSPDFQLDARPDSVAIDDRGVATIAWDEIGAGDRIQVATRGPGADWSQGTLATGINLNAPAVSTTADGRLVAAWRDTDGILVQRRSAAGVWDPAQEVVSGPAGIANNLYGVAIAETGRIGLTAEQVDLDGREVRPFVVVQDGPGTPWQQEFVTAAFPDYGIDAFQPEIAMGRRGEVAVTWNQQYKDASRWYRTFVRVRTADGRWTSVRQVGRYSSDPRPAVDRKGRFSIVFGEGNKVDGRSGCCVTLRAARL